MRSVLIASVLSGVLGGAYYAGRCSPSSSTERPAADPVAKALAADLIDKLKSADPDKFLTAVQANHYVRTKEVYETFRANLVKSREQQPAALGKSTGEFDLIREQTAGPDAVRLVYLEKFERGGLAWYFVLYRGPQGWKLADVNWDPTLGAAFAGS